MLKQLVFIIAIFLYNVAAYAQMSISGTVKDGRGPIIGATIMLEGKGIAMQTDVNGRFAFGGIDTGNYVIVVSFVGHQSNTMQVHVGDSNVVLNIILHNLSRHMDTVTVNGIQLKNAFSHLRDIEGTAIYAGKKTEVVVLKDLVGNKATNNARQVYAKVAGLNIWENDAAGLQLAIGGRGLSPNRVANFNTRQNGYDISADALGYPESYYTPPAEAVERIEIVRGAASLQYGTQFGGMINFRMLHGSDTQKIAITSRLTGGSFRFVNSSTSVGGTIGNLNYIAFYQHKSGSGWRPNTQFNANTAYTGLTWNLAARGSISLQYTHMDYLQHQPGGLTDADFAANPHQSIRARNWFRVNWNLGAIALDYQLTHHLHFNSRVFGLSAQRDALGILTFINRIDDGTADRNLYIDHYRNWGNESRLLYQYATGKQLSTALAGVRYYSGHTHREQGFGNNGKSGTHDDFTFQPAVASDSLLYSSYNFPEHNLALFAENIFRVSDRVSIIPGFRFEQITTKATGEYNNVVFDLAGNPIAQQKINDNKANARSFLIAGMGITYNPRADIQLYANFSQNYKAINFNDLRTQNPNLRVDSALRDETGYSADLGVRKNNGIVHYDVNVFVINYNNKIGSILSVDSSNSIIYNLRTNVAQSVHFGLESYVEADIWKLLNGVNSTTSISVFSNLSLIHARYTKAKDPAIDGRRVEFVPDLIWKTGVLFRRKKLAASYQFSYTGSQFTDATNARFTANAIDGGVPSYIIMDVSADYTISRRWMVSASVNNFANHTYFTRRADSYPGPGIVPADARSCYLTVQFRL